MAHKPVWCSWHVDRCILSHPFLNVFCMNACTAYMFKCFVVCCACLELRTERKTRAFLTHFETWERLTKRIVCLVKLQVVTAAGEWGECAQKKEKTERFEGGSASVCIILWGIHSLSHSLKYVTAQEINKEERNEVQGRWERREDHLIAEERRSKEQCWEVHLFIFNFI